MIFVSKAYGSAEKIKMYCDSEELRDLFGGISEEGVEVSGVDAMATLGEDGFQRLSVISLAAVTERSAASHLPAPTSLCQPAEEHNNSSLYQL